MKKLCNNCKNEMIDDCSVTSHAVGGVTVTKNKKGIIKNIKNKAFDEVKALVCPKCGCVEFYIEDYKDFID